MYMINDTKLSLFIFKHSVIPYTLQYDKRKNEIETIFSTNPTNVLK
mgnify:CR=1 FL=1